MKILFFDGHCYLCNGLIDWLLKIDKRSIMHFAPLQGEVAQQMLDRSDEIRASDTVIYLSDSKRYQQSTAVLMAFSDLGGLWWFAKLLLVVPVFLRDLIYRIVAKNRYKFFGKREICRIPSEQERARFLS